jgi:hypothetical protein
MLDDERPRAAAPGINVREETIAQVAVLTFEGYNELDSSIALGVLNRIKAGWRGPIASPAAKASSMNGVVSRRARRRRAPPAPMP